MEALAGIIIIAAGVAVLLTRVNSDGEVVSRWNCRSRCDGITGSLITNHNTGERQ